MRLGIDLGGTKIEGIALHADGAIAARIRTATPAGDYAGTLQAVAQLLSNLENVAKIKGRALPVGFAIPGALDATTGLVKNANSTCLIGRPLGDDLRTLLGRPIRLENDANCFTASEAKDGAATGYAVAFGVILGTGVGGAIAVEGRVLHGAAGLSGEWGHNPLPWPQISRSQERKDEDEYPGPLCYCGKTGCIETFLSGPGLGADHARHRGGELSPEEIVARAREGDATAEASLQRYESRLARALAGVINILDPDVIVLGGGLSNMDRLYRNVPRHWTDWIFGGTCATRLVRNTHGDSSGVRGAAWLWPDADRPSQT
ncbi:ROK family protein [Varunaivibrio sulfuroxidans]|uniref:N-acetylglucosamine kinase n=1 Tax=Varunaivibrio sulfuroxidans TaxID=1773489 RepID=A0A4R3J3E1_9PROT|nr:ROK family protein [Varunaivibrio sulfuroxidans]TCS60359.1 N-acetylglucosamine kinase [Varunaivibrio sulfuroxidans]WES30953.1 ROK family protein [Varunaivibrio sulfuroxidans]